MLESMGSQRVEHNLATEQQYRNGKMKTHLEKTLQVTRNGEKGYLQRIGNKTDSQLLNSKI